MFHFMTTFIYINDIKMSTPSKLLSFADDTTLYQSYPYIDINTSVNNINLELKHLYD